MRRSLLSLLFVLGSGCFDEPQILETTGEGTSASTGEASTSSTSGSTSISTSTSDSDSGSSTEATSGSSGGTVGSTDGRPPGLLVFVTEPVYSGNLGGLPGADAECQGIANDAFGGGTFVAWLSAAGVNAIDRITGDGPWFLPNGEIAFMDRAQLMTDPFVGVNVKVDAMLVSSLEPYAWTGTSFGGLATDPDCAGWSSALSTDDGVAGNAYQIGPGWTNEQDESCDTPHSLYCFEVGP